ncbi:glycosyltransferase [Verrucomicrobiota bacterium]
MKQQIDADKHKGRGEEKKPLVVYLHRYPPEIEMRQYSAMRKLIDLLLIDYRVLYVSMKCHGKPDPAVRRGIDIMEIPLKVDQARPGDKWLKTVLYYLTLPVTLWRIRKTSPDFIICKEQLPFIPSLMTCMRVPMLIAVSDWWWSIFFGGSMLGRRIASWFEGEEVKHWNLSGAWVVANSRAEAEVVSRKGFSRDRIRVINTPFLPDVYQPCNANDVRWRLGLGENLWCVSIHGMIRPGKGYGQILEWWKELIKKHDNWRLIIIGGGGGESWCRKYIKSLGLKKHVIITGWLPSQEDVNKHLNASDCLLVVRRNSEDNEGNIPSALYHSLATGKPTVATGLAGISEIVRDRMDGFLFKPDNYESFKNVLEYVYSHPKEAEIAGKSGIKRVKECLDPDRTASMHVALIKEILKEKNDKA